MTMTEHDNVFDHLGQLMYTVPDELPAQRQHIHLIDKDDFEEDPLTGRRVLIPRTTLAISAKENAAETTASRVNQTEKYRELTWNTYY